MLARIIIATTLLMALPAGAADKGSALTVYGGYRSGGSFTDANTGQGLKLESNGAAALALDFPYQASGKYQIFVSRQHTDLLLDTAPSAGSPRCSVSSDECAARTRSGHRGPGSGQGV